MKKILLYDDVFKAQILAIHGTTKDVERVAKNHKLDYTPSTGSKGCCYRLPDNYGYLLWLEDCTDFYALLHETVHLVKLTLEDRGMNTNLSNEDEVFAYYQMFWFRKLWRFYGNIKPEDKKNGNTKKRS